MMKRPTQADVARLAGVSRATVSMVLNDHIENRLLITEKTRSRVLEAASQLGYEPNELARNLRAGSSKTIGFLIPDTRNPHYLDVLDGVEEVISEKGYYLALVVSNLSLERELQSLRSLFQQRLDGLILMPIYQDMYPEELDTLRKRHIPAVLTTPVVGSDWVFPDIRSGSEQMMDHLISLGHRRIAFINGVVRSKLAEERLDVYQEKMHQPGFDLVPEWVRCCGHDIEDGYHEAAALLDLLNPPTAIWTINDILAVGALRAIHEKGLRIPEDIALAGFDDIEIAQHLYPPLTTVRMDGQELGRQAVRILFRRMENPVIEPVQEVIPTQLIIRQSTTNQSEFLTHSKEQYSISMN